jgi:hypothetical protein
MRLTDRSARVARFANQLAILVKGFDDDPRELFEVPTVRRFFQAITQNWPYWLHFLNADAPAEQIPLIYQLLTAVERVPLRSGYATRFTDPAAASQLHARLVHAMCVLHAAHGIPHAQTDQRLARLQQIVSL